MTTLHHAHTVYEYGGRSLTLMYPPDAIGVWEVYDGMRYLGLLVESFVEWQERYTPRRPGSESSGRHLAMTDDWQSAVVYLLDAA